MQLVRSGYEKIAEFWHSTCRIWIRWYECSDQNEFHSGPPRTTIQMRCPQSPPFVSMSKIFLLNWLKIRSLRKH
jgi:hypothetical protein